VHRTRIKICGITNAQDAAAAVAAGADAIGVVLAASPRRVTLGQAEAALAAVPPLVARVGVFVDEDADVVAEAVRRLKLTAVQFHGAETPERCAAAPVPAIRAFRVGADFDAASLAPYRGSVAALLLDTLVPGVAGGTGVALDWRALPPLPAWAPVLLAGGLTPGNVGEAVSALRPYAVDVSSGVEERPGRKDHALIESFVAAVAAADVKDVT
jgi:phosphoribosylanthranilate isomerase